MVNGTLQEQWLESEQIEGAFQREESVFRDWVTADGASGFPAEPGRSHLYVSLACPWASRTLIFRKLNLPMSHSPEPANPLGSSG
jgi:putative glutathione S-transferase